MAGVEGASLLPPAMGLGPKAMRDMGHGLSIWLPSAGALWGLFPHPLHASSKCPRCCFRLLTPEPATGVSMLSSVRAIGMQ